MVKIYTFGAGGAHSVMLRLVTSALPIGALVRVPTSQSAIQLLSAVPPKATQDGPIAWTSAPLMGDQNGVPESFIQPGSGSAAVVHGK